MDISIRSFQLPYYSYSLFDVNFYGDTVKTLVTHKPCIVDTWISDIELLHSDRLCNLVVGLGIEWRPNSGTINCPIPAILQLCVGLNCLIFQIRLAPVIPESLKRFLTEFNYTFVGFEIRRDVEKLCYWYGLWVRNTIDLRDLAASRPGKNWLRIEGVVRITQDVLGRQIEKPMEVALSNWENNWLSLDQIQYACIDALVSFRIGVSLNAHLVHAYQVIFELSHFGYFH